MPDKAVNVLNLLSKNIDMTERKLVTLGGSRLNMW
jgi:hypothetical protein